MAAKKDTPSLKTRVRFADIDSRTWEHPSDRTALTALRGLRGFDQVLRTLSGFLRERQYRLLYLASAARSDERQFSDLHALLADCARTLDTEAPELFITQSPVASASCLGMEKPFIVVTSGMYELMDAEEMRFVLGHELGHALSGHAVYATMLRHLLRLANSVGFIPIGGWALRAIVAALMEWQRKSELSGDRAGLLCAQDPEVAIRVQLKLAGGKLENMDSQSFLAQAAEYQRTGDLRDGLLKLLNLELQSHPFSVLRAAEINKWVDRGEYGKVLAGQYVRRGDPASFTEDLSDATKTYKDNFDQSEDPLIKGLRDGLGSVVEGAGQAAAAAADSVGRKWAEWRAAASDKNGKGDDDAKV